MRETIQQLVRPYRHLVSTGGGKLPQTRSVREHGPDLKAAAAVRAKDQMQAIRPPNGVQVAARAMSQLRDFPFGNIHHEDIEITRFQSPSP